MALLDLDKIIVHRTITGIRCNSCEGNLVRVKMSFTARMVKLLFLGRLKPANYECEHCKKRYVLL
ncbi:hypothetical protein FLA_1096 [Filimonas lacunae]|nr:hypothetical protein FLA_1096 [Filimonas lacunae]